MVQPVPDTVSPQCLEGHYQLFLLDGLSLHGAQGEGLLLFHLGKDLSGVVLCLSLQGV